MVFPILRIWAAKHLVKNRAVMSMSRPRKVARLSYRPLLEILEERTVPSSPDQIQVRELSLAANDLVYDAANQMIYASVPGSAGFGVGNSITAIDPNAGTIGPSVFVGSEPTKLAISDNGHYVYVGLNGADAVARFNVPNQNVDLQFSLPLSDIAEDIDVLPGAPQSVAVTRTNPTVSPGNNGTAIYDNGVQRPNVGFGGDSIEFSDSANRLYGYDNSDTSFAFTQMTADANGITVNNSVGGLLWQFNNYITFDAGLIYSTNARVVDPEALKLLGTYPNAGGSVAPDSAADRTYFLTGGTLQVFDQATFTPIESFAAPDGGGASLIRWGANGLAYRTGDNHIILINLVPATATTATGVDVHAAEGTSFSGPVATISDNDQSHVASDFSATIDWGDGSTSSGMITGSAGQFTVTGSHTYADEGFFPVNVQIFPPNSAPALQANSTATITDTDLSVSAVPISILENQAFSGFVATFSDAASPDDAGAFSATILWADGSSSAGTVSGSNGNFLVSGSHTYNDEGNFQFTVMVTESGSPSPAVSASATASVTEADALTVTGTTITPTEGILFAQTVASFSDTNTVNTANDFRATINWGDGNTSTGLISGSNGAFTVAGSHTYAEEGSYAIKVSVSEDGSGSASGAADSTANVNDAPLMATGTPVHAIEGAVFSGQVATFTDANPDATTSDYPPFGLVNEPMGGFPGSVIPPGASINWGDGTSPSNGTVTQPGGTGSPFVVTGSHTYTKAGSYTISVTINDLGGSTTSTTTTATVTESNDIVGRVVQNDQLWTGVSTGSSFNSFMWGSLDPSINWVDPVSGDFNGDGLTDIAARDANTGNWWVGLSNGSGFTMSVWTTWSTIATWVDVQVGDFNGDGKTDIIGRYAEGGQWWVAKSNGSGFTNSRWDTWSTLATWADVKVADFNGDGKADITGRYLQGGQWWTGLSTDSSFTTTKWTTWSTEVTWVDVQVGDFNGDGFADIAGRTLETGQWWVGYSTTSSFQSSRRVNWSTGVTWVDVKVGDFNGDGESDLIGRALETGQWWVSLSTDCSMPCFLPTTDYATSLWSTWSTGVTWVDVQVGDFNGDGQVDITGRALETGDWWTGLSNGSTFTTTKWATWSTAVTWTGVRAGDFA